MCIGLWPQSYCRRLLLIMKVDFKCICSKRALLTWCFCCYSRCELSKKMYLWYLILEPSSLSSFQSESEITPARVNGFYFALLCLPSWCAGAFWHPLDICLGTTSWGYRLPHPSRFQHLSLAMATNQILASAPSPSCLIQSAVTHLFLFALTKYDLQHNRYEVILNANRLCMSFKIV